jgi:ABC-type multidrug transport system ATPase subunit
MQRAPLHNGADGGGGGVAARRIGFVTQDDTMFASLTVRETLRYAALLRLPSAAMSRGEKVAAAAEVTQQLGGGRTR